ncbi:glycosyltransferase [Prosthecomicrobium hirschii]|uniref:glycosyltransferase n=1 Tax=Prosthecodimorpha hirschii TaxID=665126 RepID=UPI00222031C1|nr:glycosyltransferase [Prosthecomicrobium hirschii]
MEALAAVGRPDLEIHVIVPDRGPLVQALQLRGLARHIVGCVRAGRLERLPGGPSRTFVADTLGEGQGVLRFHHIDAGNWALAAVCRKNGIDVVLPSFRSLGHDFPIPWVGYIADFQPYYYPDYFSLRSKRKISLHHSKLAAAARVVIVNANAVANDLMRFIPESKASIVRLPFSASPCEDWLAETTGVAEKYGVGGKYFMISNQFWIHKRHDVAFRAFHNLTKSVPQVQLVCTGNTHDGRDPSYFPRLIKYLKENNIEDRVKILGLIPKRDQVELMKGSVAVVQPTAFEGGPGGGSVYDAVALGVPTIVSDIPINREIESWIDTYFPLDDAEALCVAMAAMLRQPRVRSAPEELMEWGSQRKRQCGEMLLAAALEAIGRFR